MNISVGSTFQINFSGDIQNATVKSFDGSIISLDVNGSSRQYIVVNTLDSSFMIIFDNHGNKGLIRPIIPLFENIFSNPSSTNEERDSVVWRMVCGEVPKCKCFRCTLNHINFLRNAARNPPIGNNMSITIACIYIIDSMIPRLMTRLVNNFRDDIISQVLQESIADGPKRIGANTEVISSLASHIHPYDESVHKCDTCIICMESFNDIATETKKPVMIISCPNCDNCFCAGKSKCDVDAKEDKNCCQGFLRLMGDDNRCPICRIAVKDWTKVSTEKEAKVSTEKEAKVTPKYISTSTVSDEVSVIDKLTPQYISYPMVSTEVKELPEKEAKVTPKYISASTVIPFRITETTLPSKRQRRKFPPRKLKSSRRRMALHTFRHPMRHKRQHYGR